MESHRVVLIIENNKTKPPKTITVWHLCKFWLNYEQEFIPLKEENKQNKISFQLRKEGKWATGVGKREKEEKRKLKKEWGKIMRG